MRLAEINKRLEASEKERGSLYKAKGEALGRSFVTCTDSVLGEGCGRRSQIRTLVYIQTHWYMPPHGCTEGDSWRIGEGQFDCSKCGIRNRLYDRPEIEKRKRHFKATRNEYEN